MIKPRWLFIAIYSILSPPLTKAALLVYEPFVKSGSGGYTGSTLDGQGPTILGFNNQPAFAGNWTANLWSTNGVFDGSLGRTNLPYGASTFGQGGRVVVYGGGALGNTNPTTIKFSRSLSVGPVFQQFSSDMNFINKGTIFISFMLQADRYFTNSWACLGLGDLKIGRFNNAGNTSGAKSGSLGINYGPDGFPDYQFNLSNVTTTQNTHFYVVQLDLNAAGTDSFSAWLDPTSLSAPAADLRGTGLELSFNKISLETAGWGLMDGAYDEIRIGSTWSDVIFIPEPSALSLLAVGLGGLAMMRRHRSQSLIRHQSHAKPAVPGFRN
jgi:hypothetical protein